VILAEFFANNVHASVRTSSTCGIAEVVFGLAVLRFRSVPESNAEVTRALNAVDGSAGTRGGAFARDATFFQFLAAAACLTVLPVERIAFVPTVRPPREREAKGLSRMGNRSLIRKVSHDH